ncbi:MAG: membrane protein insertion efficiency factor YidD [Opitutae bacterium]|jgi:putative membrane protein insertion efficiency factor|nr:membrane protein insertion efficiency factor YidD [Opitutae bacterium]
MNDELQQAQLAEQQAERTVSILARLAAVLVRIYQLTLSPLKQVFFGSNCSCRFQPTCSCYAHTAFLQYGFWRGCWYAIRRILRCHPWHSGGYDPLPSLNKQEKEDNSAHLKSLLDG